MMKMPLLAALGLSGEAFFHIVVKMTGRAHEGSSLCIGKIKETEKSKVFIGNIW